MIKKSATYGNMKLSLTKNCELRIEFINGNVQILTRYQTNSLRDFLNWYKK